MNCKKCGRAIPDGSAFCNWCGAKQIKPKRGNAEITVPKARQLKSGTWFIQLRLGGQSYSITGQTEKECNAKALMVKTEHMNGKLEEKKAPHGMTVRQCCRKFIDDHYNILSPSTRMGYEGIIRNRAKGIMDTPVDFVKNWQSEISSELMIVSEKTTKNAFGFIFQAVEYCGYKKPSVKWPKVPQAETKWLTYDEILTFCDAIRGEPGELGALLALHSLRKSEIIALTTSKIDKSKKTINVSGSVVVDEHYQYVRKKQNKTKAGTRVVPIMIPRILDLIPDDGEDQPLVGGYPNTLYKRINRVCQKAGLPEVGIHGLRRSFASLGYHLGWSERLIMEIGGWDDLSTVHKMYVKIAEADKQKATESMANFYTNAN